MSGNSLTERVTAMTTRGEVLKQEVVSLLKARTPLIWIVTREEARVERALFDAAAEARYVPYTWDCAQGVASFGGEVQKDIGSIDIGDTLAAILERTKKQLPADDTNRAAWIIRDVAPWLEGAGGLVTKRQLRNLIRVLPGVQKNVAQALIVITTSSDVPAELAAETSVIEWSLPDRVEIAKIIDRTLRSISDDDIREAAAPNGVREAAIDAAVGLTEMQALACYSKSLVKSKKIVPTIVSEEKKRVISSNKALEWFDPLPGGLDMVGGLDVAKAWSISRKAAYSKEARDYGLKSPKGILVVGVQGCGKSLFAKALATTFAVPLLKIDMGAMKERFVGSSEENIRTTFRIIESVGRCVVWLDEVEKALAGAIDGGADGGVAADALGTFLTWMQERQGEAFVIATSNDISKLPPEFYRKGRFDEIFFVDLPNKDERSAILQIALKTAGRDAKALKINLLAVSNATEGFVGAEVAELVTAAMFVAFLDGKRELTTADLITEAKRVVPISKTASDKINKLREWAVGRARFATSKGDEKTLNSTFGPDLDL